MTLHLGIFYILYYIKYNSNKTTHYYLIVNEFTNTSSERISYPIILWENIIFSSSLRVYRILKFLKRILKKLDSSFSGTFGNIEN